MSKTLNGVRYFSASETAKQLGIHRLTLLRWIREGKIPDAVRDRNGWRLFDANMIDRIAEFAHSTNESNSSQLRLFRTPVSYNGIYSDTDLSLAEKSED